MLDNISGEIYNFVKNRRASSNFQEVILSRKIISLNGNDWLLGKGKTIGWPDDWQPADVPGDVHNTLFKNGQILDPFYAKNNNLCRWVEKETWYYQKKFSLDLQPDEQAWIKFYGVDYIADFFLNDKMLGSHTGMFSPVVFNITPFLKKENILMVKIYPSYNLPTSERMPKKTATLKCQMSFGWDFAPPLKTMAIWDDVELYITGSLFIHHLFIKPENKIINLELDVESSTEGNFPVEIITRGKNFETEIEKFNLQSDIKKGQQKLIFNCELKNPKIWSPWDKGYPHLYEIEINIGDLDSIKDTFGIRNILREKNPDSPLDSKPWIFVVNDKREYIRGANWVPMDSLLGKLSEERYAKLIKMAKEAYINMFRLWGGGLREKKVLYDLCDEEGIMIWQEFPLACGMLYPKSEEFLNLLDNESRGIITTLRNHPSLAMWCGGNEISLTRNKQLVDVMENNVQNYDGTRPWQPVSPAKGDIHNWRIWHALANYKTYLDDEKQFASEFGHQSFPNLESLKKFIPEENLWPISPKITFLLCEWGGDTPRHAENFWKIFKGNKNWLNSSFYYFHHAQLRKLWRYGKIFGEMDCLENTINYTQRAQALALKIAIEHFRRRKWKTGGTIIWQINEPWPSISWSIIDYYAQPKLAYEILKKIYHPLLVSVEYEIKKYLPHENFTGKIWVINDYDKKFENTNLELKLNEKTIFQKKIDIASNETEMIDEIKFELPVSEKWEVKTILEEDKKIISENYYDLKVYDPKKSSRLFLFFFDWSQRFWD